MQMVPGSFPGFKEKQKADLTSNEFLGLENVGVYIHSPIRFQGQLDLVQPAYHWLEVCSVKVLLQAHPELLKLMLILITVFAHFEITSQINTLLGHCNKFFLEKPTVAHLLHKFNICCRKRRFITIFQMTRYWIQNKFQTHLFYIMVKRVKLLLNRQ
jgi:hypothetical protein